MVSELFINTFIWKHELQEVVSCHATRKLKDRASFNVNALKAYFQITRLKNLEIFNQFCGIYHAMYFEYQDQSENALCPICWLVRVKTSVCLTQWPVFITS